MRYLGQNYELEIPIDIDTFSEAEIAGLFDAFHAQHEARFGFRLDDHMEIVNFLVTGMASTGELTIRRSVRPMGTRRRLRRARSGSTRLGRYAGL